MRTEERIIYDKLRAERKVVFDKFREKSKNAILNRNDRNELEKEFLNSLYDNQMRNKRLEKLIGRDEEHYFNEIINNYYSKRSKMSLVIDILRISLILPIFIIIWYRGIKGYSTSLILLSIPICMFLLWLNYATSRYIKHPFIRRSANLLPMVLIIIGYLKAIENYRNSYVVSDIILIPIAILLILIYLALNKNKKSVLQKM